jgi:hypothetical protein
MSQTDAGRVSIGTWGLMAVALLGWNGLAAAYANPLTLTIGYDGTSYQLLARNRLRGHYGVGDSAHTVRDEGRHPMWRPGLVWVEEQLTRLFGSVQAASAAASGLGITLMELALLLLAWRAFGKKPCVLLLLGLLAPLTISAYFLTFAVRQGPEPWAAALLLFGLVLVIEAISKACRTRDQEHSEPADAGHNPSVGLMSVRLPPWLLAVFGGGVMGLAEWFRTGNVVVAGVPLLVFGCAAVLSREWGGCCIAATALATFLAVLSLGGIIVPSKVNKTVVNLSAGLMEVQGPKYTHKFPDGKSTTFCLGGLRIVPGTNETYYDYLVRTSKDTTAGQFFREHAGEILQLCAERLSQVMRCGASGLRLMTADLVFVLFAATVLLCAFRIGKGRRIVLALAAGALAHYLGPVVLLCGDEPRHYLLVALPFMAVIAAHGAIEFTDLARGQLRKARPALVGWLLPGRRAILGLLLLPFACLSIQFHRGALASLQEQSQHAQAEQAALDALHLEGRKVATKNMGWFIDRNIQAVLLPYATVAELETYAAAQGIDGILVWDNEPTPFFKMTPYGPLAEFDKALRQSTLFGPAQVSGTWRWYPVRPGVLLSYNPQPTVEQRGRERIARR